MKKLTCNSIDIHPMSETPDVKFKYINYRGRMSDITYNPPDFRPTSSDYIAWIPVQFEVINEITFDELEIGEAFSAHVENIGKSNFIKVHGDWVFTYAYKIHKDKLTNIKRLREID